MDQANILVIGGGVIGCAIAPATIRMIEPHIRGSAALEVPSTGIVSAEDLVRTLARLAADRGANIVPRAKVLSLTPAPGTVRVGLEIGDQSDALKETIEARCV